MFDAVKRSMLACVLTCAVPSSTAQNYQDTQRLYDEQRRQRQELDREAQKRREGQQDLDAALRDIERDRDRHASQGQGSGEGSSLAPALLLVILVGGLLELARQPASQRPPAVYAQETERQRQGFIYRQCKTVRQSALVYPKYEKPNSHALIRLFQSDRAAEFKAAVAKYETALAEAEPTCKCVGDASVSERGFSEPEWKLIGAQARQARPWMALEESRVRGAFDACAAHSPSEKDLSWLYVGATR